jgi:glycosyltransferase involved in cell wall biosynthesis
MPMLVSIIVPTFNRGHLIGETIHSVIDQSYTNWELIIVDDGSTDDTQKRVKEFKDKRIQLHYVDHSGVLGKVRNTGINFSQGEFIAFLDSDDLWFPNKLERQLSSMRDYPQAAFIFGDGQQFGNRAVSTPEMENLFVGNVFIPQLIEERFIVSPTTFLFKREVLNITGPLNENLSGSDNEFFFRMAWSFTGIFCGEKLVQLRKHDNNISLEREMIFSEEQIQIIKKFYTEKMLTRKQFNLIASKQHYNLGLLNLQRKNPKASFSYFLNFNLMRPINYKGWLRLIQSMCMQAIKIV